MLKAGIVAQPSDGVMPPRQNSIGLIVFNSALELAGQCELVVCLKHRDELSISGSEGFEVAAIKTPLDDVIQDFAGQHPNWSKKLGLTRRVGDFNAYARKVDRVLGRFGADLAHVMNYWQWCRTLKRPGRKVVLEMQCEWLAQMDRKLVERQLLSTDAVIGVSDHIANQFRRTFPNYQGIVATAYNGVNTDVFIPKPGTDEPASTPAARPKILFVGRMSPEKGIHVLLPAFADVLKAVPDAVLELAGPRTQAPVEFLAGLSDDPLVQSLTAFYDGRITRNYQEYLDSQISDLGLGRNVEFLGNLAHAELVARYQSASVVVNPSFSESFGISIVEGMSSGIPVVGTRIGGMAETILHEKTGMIIEPDRPDQLANAIISILQDPQKAANMGAAGRRRAVDQFTWKARAQRLMTVYEEAAERR